MGQSVRTAGRKSMDSLPLGSSGDALYKPCDFDMADIPKILFTFWQGRSILFLVRIMIFVL